MSASKILLSAQEFDQYPFEEDKRYELDEGELIEMTRPAYLHNRVLIRFTARMFNFLEKNPIGEVLLSENLYALSPNTRLAPDLAVILGDRRGELVGAKVIHVVPDLAIEVLSPSETPARIHRKLGQYFEAGVKEVWLVNTDDRSVELFTGGKATGSVISGNEIIRSALLPGFELPLADLFA